MSAIERSFIKAPTEPHRKAPTEPHRHEAAASTEPDSGHPYDGLPYKLIGTAEDGLLTDVLQVLGANRKTGRFSLYIDEPKDRFDVFFREGRICHATAHEVEGEAAFFLMMVAGHRAGHYGFLEGEESDLSSDTISAKTEFLILEALRRIDEEQQSATAPQTPKP